MGTRKEMNARLRALAEELSYCGSFRAFLYFDTGTFCSPKGYGARAKLNGYLAKMTTRLNTGEEAQELLDYFDRREPENKVDRAILRELKKQYNDNEKLGMEWNIRFSELTSIGKSKWIEAREKDDFSLFEPVLRETFELAREKGRILGASHPMEAFINDWDREITVKEIDALFADLKVGILDIYEKVEKSGVDFDDNILHRNFSKDAVARCGSIAAKALGYKEEYGGFYETIHPFAAPIAPTDARICTNYDSFTQGIYSTIHEAGHTIYQQCVPEEILNTNLRSGWPGMIHESQSLFYENIIGKSLGFTQWILPIIQREITEFKDVTAQELYEMVNRVQRTAQNRTSDELTSCLKPLMSYEIEKEMLEGTLDVHDLPEAWNELSEEYFGTRPRNLKEGALRSMQWSIGALGFFQSYPLGSIIDGQLRAAMLKENPDFFNEMSIGRFDSITSWLNEKIHRHQKVALPLDILFDATGEKLTASHYVDYLNDKYSKLYKF